MPALLTQLSNPPNASIGRSGDALDRGHVADVGDAGRDLAVKSPRRV